MAIIQGDDNNNELFAEGSGDELWGLGGDDILDAIPGTGSNILRGGTGDDELYGKINDQLFGDEGNDTLDTSAGEGGNILDGGDGDDDFFLWSNDRAIGSNGNDTFYAIGGGNILTGGFGRDRFWITTGEFTSTNIITDFNTQADVIAINLPGLATFSQLSLNIQNNNTSIEYDGEILGLVEGVTNLSEDDFEIAASGSSTPIPPLVNQSPVVGSGSFSINNPTNGTFVGSISISDPEAEPLAVIFSQGNTDKDGDGLYAFNITAAGVITVGDQKELTPSTYNLTVRATDPEGLSTTTNNVTVTVQGSPPSTDTDGDGVIDDIEIKAGDRNRDEIPDYQQSYVASPLKLNGDINNPNDFYSLVISSSLNFTNVRVEDINSLDIPNPGYGNEVISYTIQNPTPGAAVEVGMVVPSSEGINSYFSYGSEFPTSDANPHWYSFLYDGETGARFYDLVGDGYASTLTLQHIDGQRGDSDVTASSQINGMGFPSFINTPITLGTDANSQVITVDASQPVATPISFQLISKNAFSTVNEIGVFRVNADNQVDGINPGEVGYLEAALSQSDIILSSLAKDLFPSNPTNSGQFSSGDRLAFYLIYQGTRDGVLSGSTSPVYFSIPEANSDKFNHVRVTAIDGGYTLAWEDSYNGGDQDYDDLQVSVTTQSQPLSLANLIAQNQGESEAELLDLRTLEGVSVNLDITLRREAFYDNYIGFYEVDDLLGSIGGVNPGDAGYAEAAVNGRIAGLNLSLPDLSTTETDFVLEGGSLLAPFIIVDNTPDNLNGNYEQVFFPFMAANSDRQDHMTVIGNNRLGFEDIFGGGDFDYNDMMMEIQPSLVI